MGRRSRPPEKAPLPLWRQAVLKWDADRREDFENLAAKKEFLAGMTRDDAEHAAFNELATKNYETTGPAAGYVWCGRCQELVKGVYRMTCPQCFHLVDVEEKP